MLAHTRRLRLIYFLDHTETIPPRVHRKIWPRPEPQNPNAPSMSGALACFDCGFICSPVLLGCSDLDPRGKPEDDVRDFDLRRAQHTHGHVQPAGVPGTGAKRPTAAMQKQLRGCRGSERSERRRRKKTKPGVPG
jgi:hypothetical protein